MAQIIKHSSISQEQILENILSFVETLPNANEIKDHLNSSTTMVIYQLLAGMGVFNLYKYNQARKETYLSTATKSSSIQHIAKQFGYNISRAYAPIVEMVYQGIPTITLKSGDIIGDFKGEALTYFGDTIFVEKGDKVKAYLGEYKSKTGTVQAIDQELVITLTPSIKTSIDNLLVSFTAKNTKYEVQRDVEKYIIYRTIADFSTDGQSTRLFVKDDEFGYGVSDLNDGDNYEISWIETDGYNSNISISNINGSSDSWLPNRILSYGADYELDSKIQKLAPFYYSTMRRAVTEQDYTYLCKAHSYIRDCYAQTELGVNGKWQITYKAQAQITEGETYSLQIQPNTKYQYKAVKDDDVAKVVKMIAQRANEGGWVKCEIVGQVVTISAISAREDINPVGTTTIFNNAVELIEHIVPPCCTIDIFYILQQQTRSGEVLTMTEAEQLIYAQYIENFKMAGKTIVLAPATRINKDISLKIKVKDRTLVDDNGIGVADYIKTKAREIIEANYEFQLNKAFNYAEMIASITKITMTKDFNEYQPIISCEANQGIFNLEAKVDTYYVFDNIDITFGDD